MSHVAEISLEIKDLKALKAACADIGLEFVEGQQTYKWWGRSVGDYPLPTGFSTNDLGKCEHALRVKGNPNAYEIGVCTRRDGKNGYTLLWDFYAGGHGLVQAVGQNANTLKQSYAAQVAMRTMQAQGMRIVGRVVKKDGTVVIQAE